jgi:hypothetical protein
MYPKYVPETCTRNLYPKSVPEQAGGLAGERDEAFLIAAGCRTPGAEGTTLQSHLETLTIYKPGSDQNYYKFA